jgi:deoxyribonuclease (pyrimidine dimer)
MTRINSAIKPAELCDKHLVAEYRELPRISGIAWERYERFKGLPPRGPDTFRLGTGHVLFFTYLGEFCEQRFLSLVEEMQSRRFKTNFTTYRKHPDGMNLSYEPTSIERKLLRERIKIRMPRNAKFTNKEINICGTD